VTDLLTRYQVEKDLFVPAVLDPSQTGKQAQGLEQSLRRMIVGQDEAVGHIVNIYQMHLTGMSAPYRPIGNFLFLGPTGSGKTRIVEATAEALVGNAKAVVKIDCAEFQHSHEIAKLIGSPPGYLGHRETHPLLSQEVLGQHHTEDIKISFVLFDEIEKASDALWNLLLGILDKATLTLGDNRKVDFSKTMIFLTSNLGATEMNAVGNAPVGFGGVTLSGDIRNEKIARAGMSAARRKFTPEFINRLDKIVSFQPLGDSELRRILDIELNYIQQRIFHASSGERSFVFTVSDDGKQFLIEEGTDVKYGARHLKRAIEKHLVQPLSNLIATGQVRGGDLVKVSRHAQQKALHFEKEAEHLPVHAMADLAGTSSIAALTRFARAAYAEPPKIQTARSSRRG